MSVYEPAPVETKTWIRNSYVRTSAAIQRAEPLHSYSNAELREAGFMTPWAFNAMKSIITGSVAAIVLLAVMFFFPAAPQVNPPLPADFWDRVWTQAQAVRVEIDPWVSSTMTLFMILVFANIVWRGAVLHSDRPDAPRRAVSAYLYAEGAFGLIPGSVAGTGANILMALYRGQIASSMTMWVVGTILFFGGGLLALRFLLVQLPNWIFAVNGHRVPVKSMFHPGHEPGLSWFRYLAALVVGMSIGFLAAVVCIVISSIAISSVIAIVKVLAAA